MRVRDLVWNPRQRRLRAPWRIAFQAAILAVLVVLAGVAVRVVAGSLAASNALSAGPTRSVTAVLLVAAAAVGGVWLGSVLLDRRRFRDYGFDIDRAWWRDLGFGLALGAGLMTGIFLVELAAGWVVVTGTFRAPAAGSLVAALAAALAVFLAVGVYEELLLRGYLLRNLAEGLVFFQRVSADAALAVAAVASSLVFGVGHSLNPNATPASALGIAAAGGFLAAAYVLTGDLALPVGVHVTWNVFQGPVYGFPVSGNAPAASVVAVSQRGPAVLTGGAFGPEAGLLGLLASVAGVVAVGWWVRRERGAVALRDSLVAPELRWR